MDEIEALKVVNDALGSIPPEAQSRVLRWAADRYGVSLSSKAHKTQTGDQYSGSGDKGADAGDFASLADLYVATDPSGEKEKALVAAYWHQVIQQEPDFTSFQVNKELKDLGHSIGSINKVFDRLMAQKPQLVVQLKKTGTAKQGRKRYKLTKAGIEGVKSMLPPEA
jgi:hypothetical protein